MAARTSGGRSVEVLITRESTLSKKSGSISAKYNLNGAAVSSPQ
jgi:hypothetical protein